MFSNTSGWSSTTGPLPSSPKQVFWNQTILHGSYLSMHEVQNYGWVDASNTSLLNQAGNGPCG